MHPYTHTVDEEDGFMAYVFFVAAQRAVYVSHGLIGSVDLTLLVAHAFPRFFLGKDISNVSATRCLVVLLDLPHVTVK